MREGDVWRFGTKSSVKTERISDLYSCFTRVITYQTIMHDQQFNERDIIQFNTGIVKRVRYYL